MSFPPHSCREPYVAWVGMLRQPKRPDLLIEIAKRSPQIQYVVLRGSPPTGHHRDTVRKSSIDSADYQTSNFAGQVAPVEAERVIAEAAALLCTSDQEGFPNTFLQAWSHGTPVVTLQVDPDSLIKRFDLGMVTGTVEATVKQLQRLLSRLRNDRGWLRKLVNTLLIIIVKKPWLRLLTRPLGDLLIASIRKSRKPSYSFRSKRNWLFTFEDNGH